MWNSYGTILKLLFSRVQIFLSPNSHSSLANKLFGLTLLSCRHKLHCIHTLRHKHTKHPTVHNKVKLDQDETDLQQLMVKEKDKYEAQLIYNYSHSNNYKIFHYISTLKGHTNLPVEMCYGENVATDDLKKAKLFNEYFFSVSEGSNFQVYLPKQ